MPPAALLLGVGEHLAQRLPEPQRTVTDRQRRGAHPAALAVTQQVGPRLRALAEPVGDRDQLLGAIDADADHHQQAHLVLLQTDLEVDPVDPQVYVVAVLQRPRAERLRVVLPLLGEPGDRGRRQARGRAQELFQRRHEVPRRQAVQVQQRQHLRDLRGLARPGRQDRRREPLPLAGDLVDALVVDPGLTHRHRPDRGDDLPRGVEAVAHHQPVAVLVNLTGVGLDVRGDLGQQRRGEHLPGAVAGELVEQRPTHRRRGADVLLGLVLLVDYLEHGRAFPNRRANAGPDQ